MAVLLVACSVAHAPAHVGETCIGATPSDRQIQHPGEAAPRLTQRQKAWFDHAVEHILQGD